MLHGTDRADLPPVRLACVESCLERLYVCAWLYPWLYTNIRYYEHTMGELTVKLPADMVRRLNDGWVLKDVDYDVKPCKVALI